MVFGDGYAVGLVIADFFVSHAQAVAKNFLLADICIRPRYVRSCTVSDNVQPETHGNHAVLQRVSIKITYTYRTSSPLINLLICNVRLIFLLIDHLPFEVFHFFHCMGSIIYYLKFSSNKLVLLFPFSIHAHNYICMFICVRCSCEQSHSSCRCLLGDLHEGLQQIRGLHHWIGSRLYSVHYSNTRREDASRKYMLLCTIFLYILIFGTMYPAIRMIT